MRWNHVRCIIGGDIVKMMVNAQRAWMKNESNRFWLAEDFTGDADDSPGSLKKNIFFQQI